MWLFVLSVRFGSVRTELNLSGPANESIENQTRTSTVVLLMVCTSAYFYFVLVLASRYYDIANTRVRVKQRRSGQPQNGAVAHTYAGTSTGTH